MHFGPEDDAGVAPVEALGHEDDILALCERLESDDLRDADPATAAATIRSLCQQLDATRGVKEDGNGSV